MLSKELSCSADPTRLHDDDGATVATADAEHDTSPVFVSEWSSSPNRVSTWDWRIDEECRFISADNVRRRQRYVSGVVIRPRLAPVRWSSTLIWNIDSTRKRHRSVCYLQPTSDATTYWESVYAWPEHDDDVDGAEQQKVTSFEEVLASKGEKYFLSEKVVRVQPPPVEATDADVDTGSGSASADDANKPQGAEIKLGVIILDEHKNRS